MGTKIVTSYFSMVLGEVQAKESADAPGSPSLTPPSVTTQLLIRRSMLTLPDARVEPCTCAMLRQEWSRGCERRGGHQRGSRASAGAMGLGCLSLSARGLPCLRASAACGPRSAQGRRAGPRADGGQGGGRAGGRAGSLTRPLGGPARPSCERPPLLGGAACRPRGVCGASVAGEGAAWARGQWRAPAVVPGGLAPRACQVCAPVTRGPRL